MTRWLTFDSPTAAAVHEFGGHADIQPDSTVATAVADALTRERTVVLVLRADAEHATVARITPPQPRRSSSSE